MILIKDPNSWEANYYVDYYKLMNCRTVQLWPAAREMVNCQESVLALIKSRLKKPIDQKEAIDEIFERNKKMESLFFNSARIPQFKRVNTKVYSEMLYTFGDLLLDYLEQTMRIMQFKAGSWEMKCIASLSNILTGQMILKVVC